MSGSELVLVIDAGSSGLKLYLIDSGGGIVRSVQHKWKMIHDPFFPNIVEYDKRDFKKILFGLIRELLSGPGLERNNVVGISCIAQRMGTVFLDGEDNILYFGPNIDSRGALVCFELDEEETRELYRRTGHAPPFIFPPYRYLWFLENEEETAKKVEKIMSIHDLIVYMLTGEFVTEPTVSSATLLMNIHSDRWDKKALSIFNIDENILPEIRKTGDFAGYLSEEAKNLLHIFRDIPVILGGGDTQYGVLATGSYDEGDMGCVIGHTAPVQKISDKPLIDEDRRLWTERYVLPGKWVVESNAGFFGGLIEWFADGFLGHISDPYTWLDNVLESIAPEEADVRFFFFHSIMNAGRMTEYKTLSAIIYPSPAVPFAKKENIKSFAYGLLESLAFALLANLHQVSEVVKKKGEVGLTGGVTRLRNFIKLFVSALGEPCKVTKMHNGSALACAALTYTKLGYFPNLREAIETIVPISWIQPNIEHSKNMALKFRRWLDEYKALSCSDW